LEQSRVIDPTERWPTLVGGSMTSRIKPSSAWVSSEPLRRI